jgi:hypothetical protein
MLKDERERAKHVLAELSKLEDDAPLYDDRDFQILPVPLPAAALTKDEQIALLAAIHDTYARGVEQISPWPGLPTNKSERPKYYAYSALFDRVATLRLHWTNHKATIETVLADVESELRAAPWLTREAAAVLGYLVRRYLVLSTLDDIMSGADLARSTAKKACDELIEKKYAIRPDGPNKGILATTTGLAIADKFGTNSAQI